MVSLIVLLMEQLAKRVEEDLRVRLVALEMGLERVDGIIDGILKKEGQLLKHLQGRDKF
jgi:hypothetical protein